MANTSHRSIDMTSGPVWRQLVAFTFPVLLGEIFQLSYSIIDSAIVGRFVGDGALAAVGASETITRVIVGFFTGVSTGCTVIVAIVFGRKDRKELTEAVHTIILFSILAGLVLTAVGIALVRPAIALMDIPLEIRGEARDYLQIYFAGVLGLVLYNTVSGVLRAVGDSKRPLYYLIFSSVLNTLLDVLFVAGFRWGVRGAAFATILAQLISALFCLAQLTLTKEPWKLYWKGRMNRDYISAIFSTGIPIGLQKSIVSFSNVIVMSHIAYFGTQCLAGWVVYSKISHILTTVTQSLTAAETTFVSQNYGAGNYRRAEDGVRATLLSGLAVDLVLIAVCLLLRGPLCAFFTDGEETIGYAMQFVLVIIPFQIVHVFMSTYISVLRGMGKALTGTVLMICGLVGVRQLYLMIIRNVWNTPITAGLGYPLGWAASGLFVYLYYVLRMKPSFEKPEERSAGWS